MRRNRLFFGEGIVGHVTFAHPVCGELGDILEESCKTVGVKVHRGGTYLCMEGPAFSTKAESHMHRSWGGDLIGMTAMPEARLAREAELPYALIGLPTDYDCWRPHDPAVGQQDLLQEIIGNLKMTRDSR